MLPTFAKTSVTVVRAPYRTERGQRVRDWDNASSHIVKNCSMQPADTETGNEPGREPTRTRYNLYANPNADILPGDCVEYRGTRYSVQGVPLLWESPFGRNDHLLIRLTDWEG